MFSDRRTAKRVASHYPGEDVRPYPCVHCGTYHLGHIFGHDRDWHRDHNAEKGSPQ